MYLIQYLLSILLIVCSVSNKGGVFVTTIEDVARVAGLSRTTVSRVINNHPYVSEVKRKKVLNAMEELGYVPNSAARRLRNQKTETIAVIIPRITNPFFSKLVETLEIEASQSGYRLIMCQTSYHPEKELDYLELLRTRQVDGIILCSIHNKWENIEGYLQYGPIILVNEYDERAEIPMIKLDQIEGAYLATNHLLEQGHRLLMFCKGNEKNNIGRDRELGFRKAVSEAGLNPDEQIYNQAAYTFEDGQNIFLQIKEMNIRPTAVFAGGDEVAVGIINEAKRCGCKIPNDLAVVGYDNQLISQLIEPTLTTVDQPVDRLASKAIDILLKKIASKDYIRKEIYEYPSSLIVRDSTVSEAKNEVCL